jgi:hypothetical protein
MGMRRISKRFFKQMLSGINPRRAAPLAATEPIA